jgi:hypothetical protein
VVSAQAFIDKVAVTVRLTRHAHQVLVRRTQLGITSRTAPNAADAG